MITVKKGVRPLAELVGDLVTPACRRRGVANIQLMLDPVDLFGRAHGAHASVERIIWPRGSRIGDGTSIGATLIVRAAPSSALALQHMAPQIVERANLIIGWPAIARVRVTQAGPPRRVAPMPAPPREAPPEVPVEGIAHQDLKRALSRLGGRVAASALSRRREHP